jgi:hypothetical protein
VWLPFRVCLDGAKEQMCVFELWGVRGYLMVGAAFIIMWVYPKRVVVSWWVSVVSLGLC